MSDTIRRKDRHDPEEFWDSHIRHEKKKKLSKKDKEKTRLNKD